MALEQLLSLKSCFFEWLIFEMKYGYVESPKAEIAVRRVNWASSRISGRVTEPGFVPLAAITSGGDMCFADPTRVSSAFQKNADGIDVNCTLMLSKYTLISSAETSRRSFSKYWPAGGQASGNVDSQTDAPKIGRQRSISLRESQSRQKT
jgi:hypothetical protein